MDGQTPGNLELSEQELATLRPLAREYPNVDSAMAEIARLSAILTLPKGTVHVISDIHGEDKKLRHVINNASGTLRPLAERLLASRMLPRQFQRISYAPVLSRRVRRAP
jgi:fructose-1,6-bisphosphatase III